MLSPTIPMSGEMAPHNVFYNMFEDVMFPVRTLYCPPVPPSMLMGRYKPPPRPGPKYANDLALAGPREHWAQTQLARVWRGVLSRRRLRNERNNFEVRTRRAVMIQCWWRRLRAVWRRRALQSLVDAWVVGRRESMVAERLKGYGVMMTWQRKRFEDAVVKVQRVFRWWRSQRRGIFDDDESAPREKLPFPLAHRKKLYFPWRHGRERLNNGGQATQPAASKAKGRSTSIQFRKTRKGPEPPTIEEAKVVNDAMREREARAAYILSQPEVQDRMKWKRDGLALNDFDHNAGMIQRMVKFKWDGLEKMTRQVTSEYFNNKVSIIQRSFRVFKTLRQIHVNKIALENRAARINRAYTKEKLACIEGDIPWQFNLLNNAVKTIQLAWAYYKYRCRECDPFAEIEANKENGEEGENGEKEEKEKKEMASPPPYNLIADHIARERELRSAARSKMEKEMEAARKRARRSQKYVPASIEFVSGEPIFSLEKTVEEKKTDMKLKDILTLNPKLM